MFPWVPRTVSRTVAGAIQYHKALEMLPSVEASSDLEGMVQLFISHQTYGHKKCREEADQEIRSLIWMYRRYPVYLVCDYDADLARPSMKEMVTCYVAREHNFSGRFPFASVLLAFNEPLE